MFAKMLFVIAAVTLVAAAVLGLRQQRQALAHETVRLHRETDEARQAVWEAELRGAEAASPARLREAHERLGRPLAPIHDPAAAAEPPGDDAGRHTDRPRLADAR